MSVTFEKYDSSLSKDQIENYLLTWSKRGFRVVQGRPPLVNGWTVIFSPLQMVGIRPGNTVGQWSINAGNLLRSIGEVGTLEELQHYFEAACFSNGISTSSLPTQHHTSLLEPLSVWVKLRAMVGPACITAIWDPFLTQESLVNLRDLAGLGCELSRSLRLLTSPDGSLSKSFLDKFNKELNISSELRCGKKTHARLIFLSDGRTLSPDFSLNREQVGTINTVDTAPKFVSFQAEWEMSTAVT